MYHVHVYYGALPSMLTRYMLVCLISPSVQSSLLMCERKEVKSFDVIRSHTPTTPFRHALTSYWEERCTSVLR